MDKLTLDTALKQDLESVLRKNGMELVMIDQLQSCKDINELPDEFLVVTTKLWAVNNPQSEVERMAAMLQRAGCSLKVSPELQEITGCLCAFVKKPIASFSE